MGSAGAAPFGLLWVAKFCAVGGLLLIDLAFPVVLCFMFFHGGTLLLNCLAKPSLCLFPGFGAFLLVSVCGLLVGLVLPGVPFADFCCPFFEKEEVCVCAGGFG